MTRSGMAKHMVDCPQRQEAVARGTGVSQSVFHLQVQDAYYGNFWLQLEMNGQATLKELDKYLRAIWLECCGHLSEFSYGGWGSPKVGMSRKAEAIFQPGLELTHIYDFGTSSETLIKVMGVRQGNPTTRHPIALMARNALPEEQCMECERPATYFCQECLDEDETGMLCDVHVKKHPHDDYGEPVPFVNSPRLGMCGYDGPAEPPY
jgi:hypothetical protein